MKTIKLLLSVVLLTFASNTFADNLAVEDFTIAPGSTKTISIELNNPNSEYIMVEFWLSLPNGLTIPKDEDDYYLAEGNSSRFKRSHTLEVSKQDGYYHFLIYSSRNEALKGNSGELISVTIEAASNAQIGTYTANIFNQLYNDPSKNEVLPNDVSFNITVQGQAPNDVTIVIPNKGATTYYSPYDLDFSSISGFKAYVANHYDSNNATISMQAVDDALAGTGLYLTGTPGQYTVPVKTSKNASADLLTGTNGGITLTPTAGKLSNLVLSTTGSEPLFRAATNGENVAANNAWLQLPTSIYNGQQVTITFESNSSGGLNGDLNKDGNITVTDVMILVNMALGLL